MQKIFAGKTIKYEMLENDHCMKLYKHKMPFKVKRKKLIIQCLDVRCITKSLS